MFSFWGLMNPIRPTGSVGQSAALSRRRSSVQVRRGSFRFNPDIVGFGILAQLGEHLPYKQGVIGSSPIGPTFFTNADVAQLAEQLICNQQVNGSSPLIGLGAAKYFRLAFCGWFPEWPKGADCKSVASCFGGSNPPPSIHIAGWSSLEARRAHNPKVIGSNPIPATRE